MFLIEKMELYPFSPNERVIADYILKEKYAIRKKSTAEIAEAIYASKSALVRFAKKLDFQGWVDFKEAFLEELAYLDSQKTGIDANLPFQAEDDMATIASNLSSLKKEAIDDTLALNKGEALEAAVNLLVQSETIHIFAVSNNLLNAQEFALQMSRIQKDVRIHQLQGEVMFNAYLAKKKSCAIIISYSGETLQLLRIMRLLKRQGVPSILLTSIGDNSSTPLATHVLRLATREKLYSKIGTFSTDTSITFLLECLYAGIFAKNYDANLSLRKNASRFIEFERTSSSEILKEE